MKSELLELFGKREIIPLDIDKLPDFVAGFINEARINTDAHPGILLTALLPHIAVNAGNRIHMLANSARIYPNIWAALIGPSSISRKSTAIKFAGYTIDPHEKTLAEIDPETYDTNSLRLQSVTAAKLLSCLAQNPCRLFVHHELSAWLSEMNKTFNQGYKQTVTELFDGVSKSVRTMDRVDYIKDPALSIIAATTEFWIHKYIREPGDQLGGFLQRFLFFVISDIDLEKIDLTTRQGSDLAESLGLYDEVFSVFRNLPPGCRLWLDKDAIAIRDSVYAQQYKKYFIRQNDNLMSYFTRIYDGYFYKFCLIFSLLEWANKLKILAEKGENHLKNFFAANPVPRQVVEQSLYLCAFYMKNTIPFLEIVSEQDRLAGERKIIDKLIMNFGGKAGHSALLNSSKMRKREFNLCVSSLLEREAVTIEGKYNPKNRKNQKYYTAHPSLIQSWIPLKERKNDPQS